jgi:signal transduction histidine kinase
VRRIVEAHEGRLWLQSKAGTTAFFVALPLAPMEAVAAMHPPGSNRINAD